VRSSHGPKLVLILGVGIVACSTLPKFSSAPRVPPDLGIEDNCCPLGKRGTDFILHWEIRCASAAKASVTISEFRMDRERVSFQQLDTGEVEFRPNEPKPLDVLFSAPRPVAGRALSVTLQPQMRPLPEPSHGSCRICQVPH
jgi:hypothetical protein